jgi:hypothetical protein
MRRSGRGESAPLHRLLILAICAVAIVGCAAQAPISEVTVHNQDSVMVSSLSREADLAAFARAWESKKETYSHQQPSWTYNIDIRRGDSGQRWLYDPTGLTSPLTVIGAELYRIDDATAFNAVLGIPSKLEPSSKDAAPERKR